MSNFSSDAKAKSVPRLAHDLDSIKHSNDSIGRQFFNEAQAYTFRMNELNASDSSKLEKAMVEEMPDVDSVYESMDRDRQRNIMRDAARQAQNALSDLSMKGDYSGYLNKLERQHLMEIIGKFTLALSCVIFFFIGAPLGAIIRKGGLGVPVIISVIVFIIFYLLDYTGMRMSRDDYWAVWFGKGISTMVLAPIATFFTYKANRDSTVFNVDAYRLVIMRMLGLRMKRNMTVKEVIIEDPRYVEDARRLMEINTEIAAYTDNHRLLKWPSPIKVFFRPGDDHDIEDISSRLEDVIENLSYSSDKVIIHELNRYPVLATHAHTRPFRRTWLNIITGVCLPLGIFFYFRMLRFRFRLYRDLRDIVNISNKLIPRSLELAGVSDDVLSQTHDNNNEIIKDGNIQVELDS